MLDKMTIVLVVLALVYVAYVIAEHFYYGRKRKQINLIIHVNGIRGKSTVTRLIDAGLRECGYRVFSKTTGTVPTTIDVNGTVKPINRHGPANIREQLRVLDWAAGQKASALVVECMAVNPELQYLTENRILHADLNVITNVRADHLDQMGEDLESIAYSLANTMPQNGLLVLGEDKFINCFEKCAQKRNCKVMVARPYTGEENLDTFPENIACALAVCDALKLDRTTFFEGMKKYVHDAGSLSAYSIGRTVFINALSANDPESITVIYNLIAQKFPAERISVLLNSRPDRPFRVDQHIQMLKSLNFGKLLITGSNRGYVLKHLKEQGIQAEVVKTPQDLLAHDVVFGCGNISGDGMKILDYFKQNGSEFTL